MPDADPRLMTLFAEALERTDPADRAAYLDGACEGNDPLRRRIEALLAAHDGAGRFLQADSTGRLDATPPETRQGTDALALETPPGTELFRGDAGPGGANSTMAHAPPANHSGGFVPGRVIAGRYTLLEVLGEGGMGAVYRAEQSQPVKRQVALKLIKVGMDSRSVLARFDAERQALALMDHPNIARVYDGGATEANQPFFVMELVNGVSITEYCDQHRLSVRARLELFVSVCQAVQHAHQKGIIHRDLKPSNVLVTEVDGRPTPKVIDFGVAKATEFDLTDQSLADTGAIVGTPAYMSPEQADPSSMDIDTRTDVYALGVILYELLAGSPPLDATQFKRGAFLEMLRMVREVDPPSPSTKVSTADALPAIAASRNIDPAQLKWALKGDLDWIVMKALEKDRTRRYETANGFASDVLRHLANEPVVAAPPSRAYRVQKFVRKHRAGVLAASLVLLALLAGVVGTTWGLIQAAKANAALAAKNDELIVANARVTRANADLSAATAKVEARYNLAVDAIKTFHTGVSEDFLLKENQFKELRDRLLKSASDFYGKLGALLGKETDLASRRALARSNFELADLTGQVGRNEDALAAHRQVLAAREALAAGPGADAKARDDVARSQNAIAVLLVATGKPSEAKAGHHKALAIWQKLADDNPTDTELRSSPAASHNNLGSLLLATGKLAEAEAEYRTAIAIWQKAADEKPAVSRYRRYLAGSHSNLGGVLARTGKSSEAEAECRKALAILEKLADDNLAVSEVRGILAGIHHNLATLLEQAGKPAEAEAEHRADLALRQKLADDNPAVTDFRSRLAGSHNNLGLLLVKMGKFAEAEAEYRTAIAISQKVTDDNPAVTQYRQFLANHHRNFGHLFRQMGKPAEAEAEYRRALPLWQKLADDNPTVTDFRCCLAANHQDLGLGLAETGKPSEAEAEYRKALALQEKLADDNPAVAGFRDVLAHSHHNLGGLLTQTGKPSEAEAEYRRALAIEKKLVDDNPGNTQFHQQLVACYAALGRVREAVPYLAKICSASPMNTERSLQLATLQAWFGQGNELAATRLQLLAFAKGTSEVWTAVRAATACSILPSTDKAAVDAALVLARRAVELGKGHPNLRRFRMVLGMAEYRSGHLAEADAALPAAMNGGKGNPHVAGTSAFYRAMILFRQGKHEQARALALAAAAKMKPLPADDQNPLAGGATPDDIILWLAYKEAKTLIQFDAAPAAATPDGK